jgi:hypothetical protein
MGKGIEMKAFRAQNPKQKSRIGVAACGIAGMPASYAGGF